MEKCSWLARTTGLLLFVTLLAGATYHADAQELRIGGTGSALGTMQLLASALPKSDSRSVAVTLVPNLGSTGAMRALLAGAIDIAVISRPLKAEETAPGLVSFEYGRSPFVLVTSKSGVKNITAGTLADALSGRVNTWPDGEQLRFVMRPESDGDNIYLASFSPEIAASLKLAHKRPGLIMASTDQEAADQAERVAGSLAVNTLALVQSERRKLNVLPFNGAMPSVKALAEGTYPYFKPLLMVTRGAPAGPSARFMAFTKSPQGRAILEANGHLVSH